MLSHLIHPNMQLNLPISSERKLRNTGRKILRKFIIVKRAENDYRGRKETIITR